MAFYNTTEEHGMVELCVVVTNPLGGAPDVIIVSATTQDGTAGTKHTCVIDKLLLSTPYTSF